MNGSTKPGYYGHPMIKPPEWTDLIPVYFWAGGMSGASATMALMQRLRGNEPLATTYVYAAAVGTALSGFCLIADLKRPDRFMNMLRVFKPTSPMSMGVYIVSVFGGATMTAALCSLFGVAKPLGRIAEVVAGFVGPLMSVYTAVLISDTVVPAWYGARLAMPALFAATSASTAGGVGLLFGPADANGAARRLALMGGAAVPVTLQNVHRAVGPFQDRAYKEGQAGPLAHAARAMNIAGTVCALFAGRAPVLGRVAGALLLAGGLAERFAVLRAGCNSASDPAYTIHAQRSGVSSADGS